MKIIITDCDHKDINIETKVLNDAGLNFELKQCHSEEDVILQCQDADALIVQYAKITKKSYGFTSKFKNDCTLWCRS